MWTEVIVVIKKQVKDDLHFMTLHIILLEVVIRRWLQSGHKTMNMVSNNNQGGYGIGMVLNW